MIILKFEEFVLENTDHKKLGRELFKQAIDSNNKKSYKSKTTLINKAKEHFQQHGENLSDKDLIEDYKQASNGSQEQSVFASQIIDRANKKLKEEFDKNHGEGTIPKSLDIDHAMKILTT